MTWVSTAGAWDGGRESEDVRWGPRMRIDGSRKADIEGRCISDEKKGVKRGALEL